MPAAVHTTAPHAEVLGRKAAKVLRRMARSGQTLSIGAHGLGLYNREGRRLLKVKYSVLKQLERWGLVMRDLRNGCMALAHFVYYALTAFGRRLAALV